MISSGVMPSRRILQLGDPLLRTGHLGGILAIDRALDRNSLCTREERQEYVRTGGAAR
jgi:hypothetical protein